MSGHNPGLRKTSSGVTLRKRRADSKKLLAATLRLEPGARGPRLPGNNTGLSAVETDSFRAAWKKWEPPWDNRGLEPPSHKNKELETREKFLT